MGPFPYTTGSLQLLSRDLATEIASSTAAQQHVAKVLSDLELAASAAEASAQQPRGSPARPPRLSGMAAARLQTYGTPPAFEDVWMGYALHALLPRHANRTVTLAILEPRAYTYDDWGFTVRNTVRRVRRGHAVGASAAAPLRMLTPLVRPLAVQSMLLHWKMRKARANFTGALSLRLHTAHELISALHCPSEPRLACDHEPALLRRVANYLPTSNHATKWATRTRHGDGGVPPPPLLQQQVGGRSMPPQQQRYLACLVYPSARCASQAALLPAASRE